MPITPSTQKLRLHAQSQPGTDDPFETITDVVQAALGGDAGPTLAEIDRIADVSSRLVTVTTTPLAIAEATHEGKTVVLSKADNLAVTLPAATGSGARYRFVIGVLASGGAYTIGVTGNDTFKGLFLGLDDDGVPPNAWAAASNSNLITLDGSTRGGKVGDLVEIEDIAADIWLVQGRIQQSGTEATPFSNV